MAVKLAVLQFLSFDFRLLLAEGVAEFRQSARMLRDISIMSQVFETISVSNCDAAYIPRAGIATELRTVPWSIVTVKGSWFGLVLLLLLVLLVTLLQTTPTAINRRKSKD